MQAFRPAGYNAVEGEGGRFAAAVTAVEYRAVDKSAFVVALHSVGGGGVLAAALCEHHVLQSAFGGDHAFLLGVVGEEGLARFACCPAGFFLHGREAFVYDLLCLAAVDACLRVFQYVFNGGGKFLGVDGRDARAFQVVADYQTERVAKIFHLFDGGEYFLLLILFYIYYMYVRKGEK